MPAISFARISGPLLRLDTRTYLDLKISREKKISVTYIGEAKRNLSFFAKNTFILDLR